MLSSFKILHKTTIEIIIKLLYLQLLFIAKTKTNCNLLACQSSRIVQVSTMIKKPPRMKSRKKPNEVLEYCVPKEIKFVCMHVFFRRNKKGGETFNKFMIDLTKLSLDCELHTLRESLIRDKIMIGIQNKSF